jgi:hypothetical protein
VPGLRRVARQSIRPTGGPFEIRRDSLNPNPMTDPTALVLARWREEGVALNAPASDAELARLASLLGTLVPPDLRQFYGYADGMVDGQIDSWRVSFWSIERIVRERNMIQRDQREWLKTRVFAESTQEDFASLNDFFDAYLHRPESLDLLKT